MVACAADRCIDLTGAFDRSRGNHGAGFSYLYTLLAFDMDKSKQMETLAVLELGLIILYLIKRWEGLLVAALVIGIASLMAPPVARVVHWSWSRLTLLIGEVSGRILLTLVYLLVLLPLALMARLTRRPVIRRKPGGDTYFKERNHRYEKEDLLHPW
jgi:hypothetical protein